MPQPPRERSSAEEGERGARNELRTAMSGTEVGGDNMDEGEGAEVEQDIAEAEEGGLGGGGLALKATGLLTQYDDPGRTMLVTAGRRRGGLSSIDTEIGHSFSSTRLVMHRSFF